MIFFNKLLGLILAVVALCNTKSAIGMNEPSSEFDGPLTEIVVFDTQAFLDYAKKKINEGDLEEVGTTQEFVDQLKTNLSLSIAALYERSKGIFYVKSGIQGDVISRSINEEQRNAQLIKPRGAPSGETLEWCYFKLLSQHVSVWASAACEFNRKNLDTQVGIWIGVYDNGAIYFNGSFRGIA